jgi:hypothetical protein
MDKKSVFLLGGIPGLDINEAPRATDKSVSNLHM